MSTSAWCSPSSSPDRRQARSWAALCMDCTRDAVYAQLQTEVDWATDTRRRINEFLERGH